MIKFLKDSALAFIKNEKILVASEFHLGFEQELFKHGITIPSQAKKFVEILDCAIESTKARKLVIVGDIKHKVPGISFKDIKEIPRFFNSLVEKIEVICCKGNHDSYLEKILPKEIKIYSSKGFRILDYGFFHGHSWPSPEIFNCNYVFSSHLHPCIEISSSGLKSIQRVWLKAKISKKLIKDRFKISPKGKINIIVMPAFNPLIGGIALNNPKREISGPLKILIKKAEIYLLDGTFIGKLNF